MCTTADLFISMARRYYRRTRVVRPKKKWASNIKQGTFNPGTQIGILVENSLQAASPTPVIVKAGNFKIQGDMSVYIPSSTSTVPQITVLVFYLPEGITADNDATSGVISNHPEWIMAWKQLDASGASTQTTAYTNSFSFSSRLKRNLNSGDKICIGYTSDVASTTAAPTIKFTAQYWTCAN